ncbi:hypothetical protein DPMN_104553 [Dreissena polymorpha]|uniref:Uncharacterized protein n=1 Tax=Dreissena polymorpha TaxID=45954 RepID=A0A9D4K186_DREPO|nr:hypothetical protein DPMN_104553 [Dreissena polymorpha]
MTGFDNIRFLKVKMNPSEGALKLCEVKAIGYGDGKNKRQTFTPIYANCKKINADPKQKKNHKNLNLCEA